MRQTTYPVKMSGTAKNTNNSLKTKKQGFDANYVIWNQRKFKTFIAFTDHTVRMWKHLRLVCVLCATTQQQWGGTKLHVSHICDFTYLASAWKCCRANLVFTDIRLDFSISRGFPLWKILHFCEQISVGRHRFSDMKTKMSFKCINILHMHNP